MCGGALRGERTPIKRRTGVGASSMGWSEFVRTESLPRGKLDQELVQVWERTEVLKFFNETTSYFTSEFKVQTLPSRTTSTSPRKGRLVDSRHQYGGPLVGEVWLTTHEKRNISLMQGIDNYLQSVEKTSFYDMIQVHINKTTSNNK